MCLLLDTNRFGDALSDPPGDAYLPLLAWLTDPDSAGAAVIGGTKYRREIAAHGKAQRFFALLARAGRAHFADDKAVDAEEMRLRSAGACTSDDEHVIALARISGARVVCTEDQALWRDIGDKALLDAPRGRVYRTDQHAHLLHHDRSCGKAPPRARRSKRSST